MLATDPPPIPQRDASSHRRRLRRALEGALAVPFTDGNAVERLRNGDEIFPAMLDAIGRARRTVDLETFVYWSGDIAERFADALAEAANRGVRVRVLLDAVGAIPMPSEVRARLESSPVELADFRPPVRWKIWEIDNRTHRKILVCDDEAFTGGVGIAEEWTGDARSPDEWRESHFRIRGPSVEMLRSAFLEHWLEAIDGADSQRIARALCDEHCDDPDPDLPEERDPGSAAVQVLRSGAGVGWTDVQILLRTLIAAARSRLRITTAYFAPEPGVVQLLCDAADRGVEVELLNPGPHTDHRISQLAGEDVYAALLECGITIRRYMPTMLHAKVVTVDGVLSTIGSANFNHRSLARDDEICLNVLDPALTALLDGDFDHDAERSEIIGGPDAWERRSLLQRAGEWVARRVRHEL